MLYKVRCDTFSRMNRIIQSILGNCFLTFVGYGKGVIPVVIAIFFLFFFPHSL